MFRATSALLWSEGAILWPTILSPPIKVGVRTSLPPLAVLLEQAEFPSMNAAAESLDSSCGNIESTTKSR